MSQQDQIVGLSSIVDGLNGEVRKYREANGRQSQMLHDIWMAYKEERTIIMFDPIPPEIAEEWCRENCKGIFTVIPFINRTGIIAFERDEDAVLFKLFLS